MTHNVHAGFIAANQEPCTFQKLNNELRTEVVVQLAY